MFDHEELAEGNMTATVIQKERVEIKIFLLPYLLILGRAMVLCCDDDDVCFVFPGELYVSDKQGSDQDGDGTEQKPFKTPLKVKTISYFIVFFQLTGHRSHIMHYEHNVLDSLCVV